MIGWIKLHRSLIEWEWYDDKNALILLIHLLVTVNYEDKKWKGILIKSGSRVTSWETLKNEINCMSIQQIRTAMDKLESSGEITRSSTNKYQVVSLVKWGKLQHLEMLDNNQNNIQITNNQQSNNNQITTTKEVNNIKEVKEDKNNIPINWEALLSLFNKTVNKKSKVISKKVKDQINARLKEGYSKDDIKATIKNCVKDDFHIGNNFKYVTLEYISRSQTIDKYSNIETNNTSKTNQITQTYDN